MLENIINNFERIKPLLSFESEDDFYFLQIIQRRKENPELKSNSKVIKTYYITSVEHLIDKGIEITLLCMEFNARACVSLNKRSFEKMAFHTLRKISEQILNKDYKSVKNAYDKSCGAYASNTDKKWILDLDGDEWTEASLQKLEKELKECEPFGDKKVALIPTPNGFHFISKPFNTEQWKTIFARQIDIHKNNPTILYYNGRK